jgi:hypothetical protein
MSPAKVEEPEVPRPVYAGIFLCSLAVLMQEILLTRIFSFTVWYHLAYLTISTALIGFGAAGTILALFPRLSQSAPTRFAGSCAAAAGIALLVSTVILAPWPIDPSTLLSQPFSFSAGLLGYYVAVTVPFLFAGLAIATPLAAYPRAANRLYAADLLGAGLGCLAAVAALSKLDAAGAIAACAAIFVAAGALYWTPGRRAGLLWAIAVIFAAGTPFAGQVIGFVPTQSKQLAKALSDPHAQLLFTQWSPVNRVDLCMPGEPKYSFWAGIGRSPNYKGDAPEALEIDYDAHNGSNVYHYEGPNSLAMLGTHMLRTPYLLKPKPRVLVIGVGGGIDIMNAIWQGASHVTGAELQPITVNLLQGPFLARWTQGLFKRPDVELVASEGRHYVRSHDERYDILQITAVDTFSAQSTGAYVLAESYLYTVEAFEDYLSHLSDDGVLSIVTGDIRIASVPLAHVTRLALIAREALRRRGVAVPQNHIMIVGDQWPHSTLGNLLVKRTPFTAEEVRRVREFVSANPADPHVTPPEDNHGFIVCLAPGGVGDPKITRLIDAPDAELTRLLANSNFALGPVTDDHPFFFHSLKWRAVLSGLVVPGVELWYFPGSFTGQLMLLIMLAQAILIGGVLIVLPLARRGLGQLSRKRTLGFLAYFLGLGLGFLMIEISFVQKYVLVLGYPTYSLSVTVCSLLVSAAVGAALSRRGWSRPERFLSLLLGATVGLVVLEGAALPVLREHVLAASLPVRVAMTVLMQFPLGVALGMYFPTGLELLRRLEPRLIPWAWAVNGVASVAATVLAVILAMEIGFSNVALVAAGAYVLGTLTLLASLRGGAAGSHTMP